jgi:hypothetical protein
MKHITVHVTIDTPNWNSFFESQSPAKSLSFVEFKKKIRRKIIVGGIFAASIVPILILIIGIAIGIFFGALGFVLVIVSSFCIFFFVEGIKRIKKGFKYDCSEPRYNLTPAEIVRVFMVNIRRCGPAAISGEQLLPIIEHSKSYFIQRYLTEPKALTSEMRIKWMSVRELLIRTIFSLYGDRDKESGPYSPSYAGWEIKEVKKEGKDTHVSVYERINVSKLNLKNGRDELVPDKAELGVLYNFHMVSQGNRWLLTGLFPIDCKAIET